MKKIAALLVFVFSIQVTSSSFAQSTPESKTKELEKCVEQKLDYVKYSQSKIEPSERLEVNEEFRLEFSKKLVQSFIAAYFDGKKSALKDDQRPFAAKIIVGGAIAMFFITHVVKNKNVRYLKDKLSKIKITPVDHGTFSAPAPLAETNTKVFSREELLKANATEEQISTIGKGNGIKAATAGETVETLEADIVTAQRMGKWFKAGSVAATVFALVYMYSVNADINGKLRQYDSIKGKLDDLENAENEHDLFQFLAGGDKTITEVRKNAVQICNDYQLKDLLAMLDKVKTASPKEVQDTIQVIKKQNAK